MPDSPRRLIRKRGQGRTAAVILALIAVALSGCGRGEPGNSAAPDTISIEVGDARFSIPGDFTVDHLADDSPAPCPPLTPRADIASESFAWKTGFCEARGLEAPSVLAAPSSSLPDHVRERIAGGAAFRTRQWSGTRLQLDEPNARSEYHFPELNLYLQVLALDRDDVVETIMDTLQRR